MATTRQHATGAGQGQTKQPDWQRDTFFPGPNGPKQSAIPMQEIPPGCICLPNVVFLPLSGPSDGKIGELKRLVRSDEDDFEAV
jgi:hypothetical protein